MTNDLIMGIEHRVESPPEEIIAEMRVLSPKWPTFVGLLVVTLGVSSAYPPTLDLTTVVFYLFLWATISLAISYVLRNKTIRVKLSLGDHYILVSDESSPTAGRLIPTKITQKTTGEILVEREGKPWSVKRMELRFANPHDAGKATLILKRLLQ